MTEPSTLPHGTAAQLRALAAWLESHPEAEFHAISRLSDQMFVTNHPVTADTMRRRAESIGGDWRLYVDGLLVRLVQTIAPDVEFQLVASSDRVDPADLPFESVGRTAA